MTKRDSRVLAMAWDAVESWAREQRNHVHVADRAMWRTVSDHARAEAAKARDLAATLTETEAHSG